MNDKKFTNGDCVYVGERFIGMWVGINPETLSHVVYNGDKDEYKAFLEYQIDKHKSLRK